MTPELLSLLLWLPFLSIALIAGIIFCIIGYKQSLWRALISLGATALSALLAALMASGVAKVISPAIIGVIPLDEMTASLPMGASLVKDILSGLLSGIIALGLFALILVLVGIILKIAFAFLLPGKIKGNHVGLRIGGVAVRAVDAALVALLLMLPLYGSLQTYVPTAQSLLSVVPASAETTQIKQYLDTVSNHPVIHLAKPAPIKALYQSLQDFKVSGTTVNIPQIVDSANKTMDMLDKLSKMDPEQIGEEELSEIVHHLRHNVIEQDWFYAIADEGMKALKESLPTDVEDERAQMLLQLFDMDKEEFKQSGAAMLDLMDLLLRNGMLDIIKGGEPDMEKLRNPDFLTQASAIANRSDQLLGIKSMILEAMITEILTVYEDESLSSRFMQTVQMGRLDEQGLKDEADALSALLSSTGPAVILEMAVRHPMFTDASVRMLLDEVPFAYLMGYEADTPLASFLESPAIKAELLAKLEEKTPAGQGQPIFADYCHAIMALDSYYAGEVVPVDTFHVGSAALRWAKSRMSSYLAATYPSITPVQEALLEQSLQIADRVKLPSTLGSSLLSGMVELNEVIEMIKEDDFATSSVTNAQLSCLNGFYRSKGYLLLKEMPANPLSLSLTSAQKSKLNELIDALLAKYEQGASNEGVSGGMSAIGGGISSIFGGGGDSIGENAIIGGIDGENSVVIVRPGVGGVIAPTSADMSEQDRISAREGEMIFDFEIDADMDQAVINPDGSVSIGGITITPDGGSDKFFIVVIDGKKYRMDEEGNLYDLNGNPVDDLEIGDISLPEGELGGDLGDIEYGDDFFGTLIPDYSMYLEKPENVTEITAALKRFFGI